MKFTKKQIRQILSEATPRTQLFNAGTRKWSADIRRTYGPLEKKVNILSKKINNYREDVSKDVIQRTQTYKEDAQEALDAVIALSSPTFKAPNNNTEWQEKRVQLALNNLRNAVKNLKTVYNEILKGVEAEEAAAIQGEFSKYQPPAAAAPKPTSGAQQRRRRRRRRGGGVYAKGPKVGQIQQLLLKAFGAGSMQESKELNEVTAKEVLGGKGRVDSMLGKTTLKSINKIPAIAKYFADMGGLNRKNVKKSVVGILNILQQCNKAGFKDWKCKPGGKAPAAAPTPSPATPAPAPAAAPDLAKLIKAKSAAAGGTFIKHIRRARKKGVDNKLIWNAIKDSGKDREAFQKALKDLSALSESKSPLKQKEIKHFGVRRGKLLETLIKKVSK
jgi:hypothetical protein